MSLPGSGITIAALQACASALSVSSCQGSLYNPSLTNESLIGLVTSMRTAGGGGSSGGGCDFRGSLLDGAPCNEDFQCASGSCQGARRFGNNPAPTCGTCVRVAALGQSCAGGFCGPDATCFNVESPNSASRSLTAGLARVAAVACPSATLGYFAVDRRCSALAFRQMSAIRVISPCRRISSFRGAPLPWFAQGCHARARCRRPLVGLA
jgi:hypothetical protein